MIQPPLAVGLKVCQHALLDVYTKQVSLVNCVRRLRFVDFPAVPQSLTVCAVLNDGLGEAEPGKTGDVSRGDRLAAIRKRGAINQSR